MTRTTPEQAHLYIDDAPWRCDNADEAIALYRLAQRRKGLTLTPRFDEVWRGALAAYAARRTCLRIERDADGTPRRLWIA